MFTLVAQTVPAQHTPEMAILQEAIKADFEGEELTHEQQRVLRSFLAFGSSDSNSSLLMLLPPGKHLVSHTGTTVRGLPTTDRARTKKERATFLVLRNEDDGGFWREV